MNILIKNGIIIDGTGFPGYKSDVYIKNNRIEKIGLNLQEDDCELIDASNKVVSPGFIDMHSHADLMILEANKAEATIMQGVTTLVVGMCGIGLAPANDRVREYYSTLVENVFGSSRLQLFDTIQEYMDVIEKKGISTNLAFFIPHGNIRASVLGLDEGAATPEELNSMKNIIKRELEAGAFGMSTGLVYPPGSITSTEEIIELCKVVRQYGGIYDSHIRDESIKVLEGMGEFINIVRKANIQGQISHWKAAGNFAWKLTPEMIKLVENARNEGLKINADIYPYEESSTSLAGFLLKPWVFKNFKENLTKPDTRERIIDETINMLTSAFLTNLSSKMKEIPRNKVIELMFNFLKDGVRIISVLHNHKIEGKFLNDALAILYPKKEIAEALLDFVRDEEGSIMVSFKGMNERKSILSLFKQDFVCIGSDGFLVLEGNTHPRSYGTFPRILARYVREKKIVSLEEGIRKMTSLPASILGLKDRGIIKENYKADLVIFNPMEIKDKSTYQNGRQFPDGIYYVIVNGEITVKNGKHLGVQKGQILRRRNND
ncbi:MAG: D-aminoacylase [Promethearchaeota archaeon]|nr:MAG: D-aminoacylase [Candidatus Lokiarchaeota archaeon]